MNPTYSSRLSKTSSFFNLPSQMFLYLALSSSEMSSVSVVDDVSPPAKRLFSLLDWFDLCIGSAATSAYDRLVVFYTVALRGASPRRIFSVMSTLSPPSLCRNGSFIMSPRPYLGMLTCNLSPRMKLLSSSFSTLLLSPTPLKRAKPYLFPSLFLRLGMKISFSSPHWLKCLQSSAFVTSSENLVK